MWRWSNDISLFIRITFESLSFPLGHKKRRNKQEAWRSWKERERRIVLSTKGIIHWKESKTSRTEIITEKSWYGWTGNEILYSHQNLQSTWLYNFIHLRHGFDVWIPGLQCQSHTIRVQTAYSTWHLNVHMFFLSKRSGINMVRNWVTSSWQKPTLPSSTCQPDLMTRHKNS